VLGAALVTGGVGALSLGLVKGNAWGWGDVRTIATLIASAAALGGFALHTARHRNPLVSPALFGSAAFRGASVVAVLFSAAFGAMLLSIVLFAEGAWGWSALRTGLAVAPGPLMVPLFGFAVAGRAIARWGAGAVMAAGLTTFATGVGWWALAAGPRPDYAGEILGGMLLTGVGVGLTLPTMMATASASLPPEAFGAGTAVVNMLRQVGLSVGVALLVAVLGTAPTIAGFVRGWVVTLALALAAAAAALAMVPSPRRRLSAALPRTS
jgi:hypothetical protein